MIDYWAERIAISLREHNDGIVSVPIMKFALIFIINVVSIVSIVLIVSLFTNSFKISAIALLGFALLRFFSGGIHIKSATYCIFVSIIMMLFIIYVPIPHKYELALQIISFIFVIIFAPAYLENHIRIKKKYVPFLKIVSICIVLSNFYLDSSILTICFFIQSLSLIEFTKKGGIVNENTVI
jgi:accessory gene regulator B